jgi:hypothetical protein
MLPATENFQSPDTISNADAADATSAPTIAKTTLNAALLLFCISPPHANVFADDYYEFRVGISPIHGFRGKNQQTACHPSWKCIVCGFPRRERSPFCAVNPSE